MSRLSSPRTDKEEIMILLISCYGAIRRTMCDAKTISLRLLRVLLVTSVVAAYSLRAETGSGDSLIGSTSGMANVFASIKETLKRSPSGMKVSFQKIRGSELEGSKWDNEQWSYLFEFKSIPSKFDFLAQLCFYDTKGFNLHRHSILIDDVSAYKNGSYSRELFIPLSVIEKVASVKLEGAGLTKN